MTFPIASAGDQVVLNVINRYTHGLALVPVVLACRKKGLFTLLRRHVSMTLEQMVESLGANEGHLLVALRMIESLGWICRNETGEYSLTPEAEAHREIPEEILELYELPMDTYLTGQGQGGVLGRWIERSKQRWGLSTPLIADFLDGILIIPVLIALSKNRLLDLSEDGGTLSFTRVDPAVQDELRELFAHKGWGKWEGGRLFLTDAGRFMVDRTMITGVTASYSSMFRRISDLIFGDPHEVLGRGADGHETHIDRSLNVMASGFQHEKYFAGVDDIILSIFNRLPFEEQPKYIADMGCGDGTLLKRVYDVIRSRSARGTVLDRHPVIMIGIDYNEQALQAAEGMLADIPCLLLRGDIADPQRLIEALMQQGIYDLENILHIRSFLDHDRPYLAPTNVSKVQARSAISYGGVYVDSRGHAIPSHVMVQSLVEHFQRWSEVAGSHGLIIVEVHCLESDLVHRFLDESESLHFDAYHAFSMQYLVEAEVFLMAAAEAGLFPKPGFSKRFPKTLPFCRISINWFEKRPYTIRHPHMDDLPELIHLEEACWPEALRTTPGGIQRRIEQVPDGHCVLEMEGRIAAVIYSQRISSTYVLEGSNFAENHHLHTTGAPVVQLLGINVLPEFQDKGLGDQLLEFMLQRVTLKGGIESVVGITRCKDFGVNSLMPMQDYIRSRDERGQLLDPILRFHELHGATVTGIIPNFRPEDRQNEGKGVLIEYDIHHRQALGARPLESSDSLITGRDAEKDLPVSTKVEECIRSIMGQRRVDAFSPKRPLREMGLDSLDLMELRVLLSRRFGEELDSTFFFKYTTSEAIAGRIESMALRRIQASHEFSPPVSFSEARDAWDREALIRKAVSPVRRAIVAPNGEKYAGSFDGTGREGSAECPAIIGMSCRFPFGANTPDKFWALLCAGTDAITVVPKSRWDISRYYDVDRDQPWKIRTKFGGFLDRVDQFDASFFRVSPREADYIDPQQRILLECTWEALENAGLNPEDLVGSQTGIFVGISSHDYELLQRSQRDDDDHYAYFATGNSPSVAAGRLSYFFGFNGPAISVDTACSSSLVAFHLACQSLRNGECDIAIAAGVNLLLSPDLSITYSKLGMLSKEGRCKTFDSSADGYVRSEGCGVVVLKKISAAESDRDNIFAIVRGSAVNQDGASNGLTAPNGLAQEAVFRKAISNAGVLPEDISYVEAHGTGTALGDPVEIKALEEVYGRRDPNEPPLIIGSVKTNIGHTEAAAGIAGLIKVVLSLKHNHIPPHLHLREINENIALERIPAVIPTKGLAWHRPDSGRPRAAAVSSFGSSGTNAHVIVEEAPGPESRPAHSERSNHLFTLSAKSPDALREQAQRYVDHLAANSEASLADICFTVNVGRAHFEHRLSVVCTSTNELSDKLSAFIAGKEPYGLFSGQLAGRTGAKTAFLFTGQGSQYVGMGKELYATEPVFRRVLERCDEILGDCLEKPLLSVLYATSNEVSPLDETAYTQPALFALEYALAQLWRSWGIEPTAVMGHSVGEYVAACVAGVFSLEDGLKLIAERARLMQSMPRNGAMAAVFADELSVREAIDPYKDEVSIAAINGPKNTVFSGKREAVANISASLRGLGIETITLNVSHAFHSPLMEPMLADFAKVLENVRFSSPCMELISNTTGGPVTDEVRNPNYWCNHVRQPVRFAANMDTLHREGFEVFVEIGPKPILSGMGRKCLEERETSDNGSGLHWLPSLCLGVSDWSQMLQSLGALYVLGRTIDFRPLWAGRERTRVPLPTYPWQQKRYWLPAAKSSPKRIHGGILEDGNDVFVLRGRRVRSPVIEDDVFEFSVSTDSLPFLNDHRVLGQVVMPAPVLMEIVLSAAGQAFDTNYQLLEDFNIHHGLLLEVDGRRTLQVMLKREGSGSTTFDVMSLAEESVDHSNLWDLLATGRIRSSSFIGKICPPTPDSLSYSELQERCREQISSEDFYRGFEAKGVQLGPLCQAIDSIHRCNGEAFAKIRLPELLECESENRRIHPVLVDACLQLLTAAWSSENGRPDDDDIFLFVGLERYQQYGPAGSSLLCHAALHPGFHPGQEAYFGDATLFNEEGTIVADVKGMCLKRVNREAWIKTRPRNMSASLFEVLWRPNVQLEQMSRRSPPDYLPDPNGITELLRSGGLLVNVDRDPYHNRSLVRQLDRLSTACVLRSLRELGWRMDIGEFWCEDYFLHRLGVADQHRKLLGRMLEMLQEDGILKRDGSQWEVKSVPETKDPDQIWSALMEQYPEYGAELALLGRCVRGLSDVLRGESDPMHLLFPDGSITLAEKLYQDSSLSRITNAIARKTMSMVAGRIPEGRVIRILEIGAGVGGTTAHMLPELPEDRTVYVFTDISNFFLEKAKKKFQNYPFVLYRSLDIEQAPETQGFAPCQFDVILASNVLHATADLHVTLQNVLRLLSPNGLLMLVEGVRPTRWIDLVFGMTEGWWRFADRKLRSSHPLLSKSHWLELLTGLGFVGATAFPAEGDQLGGLFEQAVILAQGPPSSQSESFLNLEDSLSERTCQGFAQTRESWLIFADRFGIAKNLAERLTARGEECLLVHPGETYEELSDGQRRINPTLVEDFEHVLKDAQGSERLSQGEVIYLWGMEAVTSAEAIGVPGKSGLFPSEGLVCLVNALINTRGVQNRRLWIATRGGQSLGQEDVPQLWQAPLWGMGRVLAVEHPELWGGVVDLDPNGTPSDAAFHLWQHICRPDGEDQVAFRAGDRYVPCLVPWRAAAEKALQWFPEATYLITGGLGDLGLRTAQWMVEQGARRLILLGRTPLPERADWSRSGPDDLQFLQISKIRKMEELGAKVKTVSVDIADEKQVLSFLKSAREEGWMPIRGVVHAAAVTKDLLLRHLDHVGLLEVQRPKLVGAWLLHQHLRDEPLDFFILFSSLGSLLGQVGQASYAAANAFLDALAHYRRAHGQPAMSVNWGPWTGSGLALTPGGKSVIRSLSLQGVESIPPRQATDALGLLMGGEVTQATVIRANWTRLREVYPEDAKQLMLSKWAHHSAATAFEHTPPEGGRDASTIRDALLTAEPGPPRRGVFEAYLSATLADVLKLECSAIDPNRPFGALGLDSLMALELRNRCEKGLGLTLSATMAWNHSSIGSLASHLSQKLGIPLDGMDPAVTSASETDHMEGSQVDVDEHQEDGVLESVDRLSDEEALNVLLGKLKY